MLMAATSKAWAFVRRAWARIAPAKKSCRACRHHRRVKNPTWRGGDYGIKWLDQCVFNVPPPEPVVDDWVTGKFKIREAVQPRRCSTFNASGNCADYKPKWWRR